MEHFFIVAKIGSPGKLTAYVICLNKCDYNEQSWV